MKALLLALMLFMPCWAKGLSQEFLLERLRSDSISERTLAAREIFGAGLKSPAVYDQIAKNLAQGLEGVDKKSPRIEELAWEVKALASSGELQYMPIVERVANSGVSKLEKHAKVAKTILQESAERGRPYLEYAKVPVLTESQAEKCEMIAQENCKTSRSAEKCVSHHQNKAVSMGGNAIMILHASSRSVGFGPFGGDSTMVANYYRCM